jgi:hypothetical protein
LIRRRSGDGTRGRTSGRNTSLAMPVMISSSGGCEAGIAAGGTGRWEYRDEWLDVGAGLTAVGGAVGDGLAPPSAPHCSTPSPPPPATSPSTPRPAPWPPPSAASPSPRPGRGHPARRRNPHRRPDQRQDPSPAVLATPASREYPPPPYLFEVLRKTIAYSRWGDLP